MMRHLLMQILVMIMLGAYASMPTALAMNGPDPKKLKVVTFEISGKGLRLPLPSSRATKDLDEVRQAIIIKFDIQNPYRTPTILLDDMWDWRSPLHMYGSVGIKLYVERAVPDFDLECRGALTAMLRSKFASAIGMGNQTLPTFTEVTGIMDGRAISYRWAASRENNEGEDDEESFAIALSSHDFLTLRMNYYGGGDPSVESSDWLPRADALKQAILQGVRFKGDWPTIHDCEDRHE